MKKLLLLVLFGMLIFANDAFTRPQYSILQSFGTKCQNCHIKGESGGMRNFTGWASRNASSLVDPASIGMQGLYDFLQASNEFEVAGATITYGTDFRYQTARWGGPANSRRDYMLMQWVPYLNISPADWMNIEGWYNLAYDLEPEKRYIGQEAYSFSMTIKPWESLPSLKVGYFAPVIGTKYEDHTLLVGSIVSSGGARPMIPWDYSEYGFELRYGNIDWLDVSFGMWESKNAAILGGIRSRYYNPALSLQENIMLGNVKEIVNGNHMTTVLNVQFHPIGPWGLNMFGGASWFMNGQLNFDDGIYYSNDYFTIQSLYFHFGMPGQWAVMTEYTRTEKQLARETNNFLLELNYQVMEPLIAYARLETGTTKLNYQNEEFTLNQYVFGTKAYILPYIALLPEYRIVDRKHAPKHHAQWAVQLHIFY